MKNYCKALLLTITFISPLCASEHEFIKIFESRPSFKITALAIHHARKCNLATVPVPESLYDISKLLRGYSPEEIQTIMQSGGDTFLSDVQEAINLFNETKKNPVIQVSCILHQIFVPNDPYIKAVEKFAKDVTKKQG